MKVIIFAGGTGRRLWPISRQLSPKQFEPIIGDRSTLQLAVDRLLPRFRAEDIYVSTNEKYAALVEKQLPQLPSSNIIGEPARRDLAAAVGLSMTHLANGTADAADEPVAILWGDNTMEREDNFLGLLAAAERLLLERKAEILFIGETPRFANHNLGWIGLGEKKGDINGQEYFRFESLTYRPAKHVCEQMFREMTHVWNTGYFVTRLGFVRALYRQHQPEMASQLERIGETIGRREYRETLHSLYPKMASISFDNAILCHIAPEKAMVLHSKMGWSDPGTLYALKEAINPDEAANVTKGLILDQGSRDCLIYNYEPSKLVVAAGLEGFIVVNTEDAVLVVHKDQIPLVKEIINGLEGTELESYS